MPAGSPSSTKDVDEADMDRDDMEDKDMVDKDMADKDMVDMVMVLDVEVERMDGRTFLTGGRKSGGELPKEIRLIGSKVFACTNEELLTITRYPRIFRFPRFPRSMLRENYL